MRIDDGERAYTLAGRSAMGGIVEGNVGSIDVDILPGYAPTMLISKYLYISGEHLSYFQSIETA